MSEVPPIGEDTFLFLCLLDAFLFNLERGGSRNIKMSEFPDISPDLYLRFYLLQMNGTAGPPFIKLHHCCII